MTMKRKLFNELMEGVDAMQQQREGILPGARKFTEMGISAKKALPRVEQVERATRLIEPQEAVEKTG